LIKPHGNLPLHTHTRLTLKRVGRHLRHRTIVRVGRVSALSEFLKVVESIRIEITSGIVELKGIKAAE